jgi:hypothetical protein
MNNGDKVRVSYEGTAVIQSSDGFNVIGPKGERHFYSKDSGARFEVIEPAYVTGQAYKSRYDGKVYLRVKDGLSSDDGCGWISETGRFDSDDERVVPDFTQNGMIRLLPVADDIQ